MVVKAGKSVSFDKMERAILQNLILFGYKNGFVNSEPCADAMKSIKAKVQFSKDEIDALKSEPRNGSVKES